MSLADQEILDKLTRIVENVLDRDGIILTPDTTAADVEGWDSQAYIRIILSAEHEFGLRFGTNELMSITSVGRFLELIKCNLR